MARGVLTALDGQLHDLAVETDAVIGEVGPNLRRGKSRVVTLARPTRLVVHGGAAKKHLDDSPARSTRRIFYETPPSTVLVIPKNEELANPVRAR